MHGQRNIEQLSGISVSFQSVMLLLGHSFTILFHIFYFSNLELIQKFKSTLIAA